MAEDQHDRIVCIRGTCTGIVAVVPKDWPVALSRPLDRGEPARRGYGTLWCPKCRCKLEIGPFNAGKDAA